MIRLAKAKLVPLLRVGRQMALRPEIEWDIHDHGGKQSGPHPDVFPG
jgi:hypothetical protein